MADRPAPGRPTSSPVAAVVLGLAWLAWFGVLQWSVVRFRVSIVLTLTVCAALEDDLAAVVDRIQRTKSNQQPGVELRVESNVVAQGHVDADGAFVEQVLGPPKYELDSAEKVRKVRAHTRTIGFHGPWSWMWHFPTQLPAGVSVLRSPPASRARL